MAPEPLSDQMVSHEFSQPMVSFPSSHSQQVLQIHFTPILTPETEGRIRCLWGVVRRVGLLQRAPEVGGDTPGPVHDDGDTS